METITLIIGFTMIAIIVGVILMLVMGIFALACEAIWFFRYVILFVIVAMIGYEVFNKYSYNLSWSDECRYTITDASNVETQIPKV